ncbi:hypothetical protein MTR67_022141 [Solanum verrucosum]|uniref:FBD domain-containing protein n=1 Tax=Solanum verrucosum TaxID=315347 RepID=A0AAF0QST9_SOLVR|nr:hypothetical protein MTR67_022141 [Solanum verrucosum]
MTNVVEIKAPMLRSFDFRGSIQFIPLLAKISLIDVDYSAKSRKCDIPKFFKSFSVLENLHLDMRCLEIRQWQEDSPALPCLEMEGLSDVMFSHLKEVKLDGFLVTERGMQLIKLLLGKSPVLVRMLINTYTDDDEPEPGQLSESPSETNSFRAVVNAFWRASPKAEVVFGIVYGTYYY